MKKPQHCGLLNNNVTNYTRTMCNYNRLTDSMTGCVNSVTLAFSPSSSRPCHSAQSLSVCLSVCVVSVLCLCLCLYLCI